MASGTLVRIDPFSPFALAEGPTTELLQTERQVGYLLVSGRQDDGLWGPIGAIWLSADGERGSFLVNPWALWEGSEIVRCYRSALDRGWTPVAIYRYWLREVWRGNYVIDDERHAESLLLLNELLAAL